MSKRNYLYDCNPKHIDTGELVCAATGELVDSIATTNEARRSFRRICRGNPELGDLILVWRTVVEDDGSDHDESFLCRVRPTFTDNLADFRLGIALRLRSERRDGWRTATGGARPGGPPMADRLALIADLEEQAAELSDAALATLGTLARQLCGRCGAKAGTRSSRREGRDRVAYLECRKCG